MVKSNSQSHTSINNDGIEELKIYEEADMTKSQSRNSLNSRFKVKSAVLNNNDTQTSRKTVKQSDIKNLEKIKEKCSTSVKINVKRKVLTDIGNIRGTLSRTKSSNNSKLKDSNGIWSRNTSDSSRKFIMENVKPNLNGATGDKQILPRASCKDMKASFDVQKTKIQGRKSVATGIRTTGRNALPTSRRSLPVLQQVNVGTNNKEKGKVRTNLNGVTTDKQLLTRAPCKDMKAFFDGSKTKIQGLKSVTIGIRTTGRNDLPPERRSLPVLQQANVKGTNSKEKENSKRLEKGKGICGVPVSAKSKSVGDVLPLPSNYSNIQRTRVSDASARMASKGKIKVEIGALRRKSVKANEVLVMFCSLLPLPLQGIVS